MNTESIERSTAIISLRQRTVDPAVAIGSEGVGRVLAHARQELRRSNARCEAVLS
jgi:hypothetical protein